MPEEASAMNSLHTVAWRDKRQCVIRGAAQERHRECERVQMQWRLGALQGNITDSFPGSDCAFMCVLHHKRAGSDRLIQHCHAINTTGQNTDIYRDIAAEKEVLKGDDVPHVKVNVFL